MIWRVRSAEARFPASWDHDHARAVAALLVADLRRPWWARWLDAVRRTL